MQMLQATSTAESPDATPACGRQLIAAGLKDYLIFDSLVARKVTAFLGLALGSLFRLGRRTAKAFGIYSMIHRTAYSSAASAMVERWLRTKVHKNGQGVSAFASVCDAYLAGLKASSGTMKFHANPTRLLGTRVLVLKSPSAEEKGVILVDYNFAFSLFAKKFDVATIAKQYYIALEPSWCGYCDLDILCYSTFDFPVFVLASEPRDAGFLRALGSNLIPLRVGGNWWVDHRVYRPLGSTAKDVDVIMVSSWGRYKRHYKVFSALAKLRTAGMRLKTVLIGYPADYALDDILRQARYYGIEDQLEVYEQLAPEEVNRQLNRAKVNLLWSRREGFNRAIIEGMCAGVPCILRAKHNYAHHYAFINPQTGCFSSEAELPQRLLWMINNRDSFSPREWVLANMSCLKATECLEEAIKQVAAATGQTWTRGLAMKVSYLNAMRYWDEKDRCRFTKDYDFLQSMLRP
jgi:glycosyltransferase involved in cell wall biosynthesis